MLWDFAWGISVQLTVNCPTPLSTETSDLNPAVERGIFKSVISAVVMWTLSPPLPLPFPYAMIV